MDAIHHRVLPSESGPPGGFGQRQPIAELGRTGVVTEGSDEASGGDIASLGRPQESSAWTGIAVGSAPRHAVHVCPTESDVAELPFAHRRKLSERRRGPPPPLEPRIQPLRRSSHTAGRGPHDGGNPKQCRCRMVSCSVRIHGPGLLENEAQRARRVDRHPCRLTTRTLLLTRLPAQPVGQVQRNDFIGRSVLFRLFYVFSRT